MNDTQERLLSMYKDIRKVFESNNIRFYGGFGTALGAIRHKGFIPWDDDIDLLFWEEDLPRIAEAMKTDLDPNKYYFHMSSADSHQHVMLRCENFEQALREKKALFIDLFPIRRYPEGKIRRLFTNIVFNIEKLFIWLIDKIKNPSMHRLFRWIPGVLERMTKMIIEDESEYTVVIDRIFHDDIYPASYYGDAKYLEFEDTEIPLPQEIEKILTEMFGDYMTPPPEDKRTGASGYPCDVYADYMNEKRGK